MAKEKKVRIYTLTQVSLAVITALLLGVIANSTGIYNWAHNLSEGGIKDFVMYTVKPFYILTRNLQLTKPYETVRKEFKNLAGMEEDIGFIATYDGESGNDGESGYEPEATPPIDAGEKYSFYIPTACSLIDNNPNPVPSPGLTPAPEGTPTPSSAISLLKKLTENFTRELPFKDLTVHSPKTPLKILFIGDSFIQEGVSMSFVRLIKGDDRITTEKFARYSSGLSRPDYYNWPAKAREIFSRGTYDVVIGMLGMNDAQDFRDNGKIYRYGSQGWFDVYRKRTFEFFTILEKNSKKVYWIGAPPMRASVYNNKMQKLAEIYRSVCEQMNKMDFVDTVPIYGDKNGKFREYMKIDGKLVKVRAKDGTHWTIQGAVLVSEEILNRIRKDFTFSIEENETPKAANKTDSNLPADEQAKGTPGEEIPAL
ncbi:MAG: DUF459 domain-containing protein [Spirochaetales bacterium]|nr:DUF459 domain-containing protein [Spirochaetales bacterium]